MSADDSMAPWQAGSPGTYADDDEEFIPPGFGDDPHFGDSGLTPLSFSQIIPVRGVGEDQGLGSTNSPAGEVEDRDGSNNGTGNTKVNENHTWGPSLPTKVALEGAGKDGGDGRPEDDPMAGGRGRKRDKASRGGPSTLQADGDDDDEPTYLGTTKRKTPAQGVAKRKRDRIESDTEIQMVAGNVRSGVALRMQRWDLVAIEFERQVGLGSVFNESITLTATPHSPSATNVVTERYNACDSGWTSLERVEVAFRRNPRAPTRSFPDSLCR